MPDLSDESVVASELATCADYDINRDIAKAKRFAAALRARLMWSQESARGDQSRKDNQRILERQLAQCLAFIQSNEAPTDAQRKANPTVTHADFSTLRGGVSE